MRQRIIVSFAAIVPWLVLCLPTRATSYTLASRVMHPNHLCRGQLLHRLGWCPPRPRSSSPRQLNMVIRTPDAVVESSTTQSLLDEILDDARRTAARKPIIMQFDPSSKAIWKHWQGTIFAETWKSALRHVLWATAVFFVFEKYAPARDFLKGFCDLWAHALGVTTFTLSFFVNQSYSLWRTCLSLSRTLQGRINDLMMGLTTHAARKDPRSSTGCSEYTEASRRMLTVVARHMRLFHVFCYASFTRSYRPLMTPRGMRRMVERGLLTSKERTVLINAKVAATQRFNIILMWVLRSIVEARRANLLPDGGPGFEQATMDKIQQIRAEANTMESELRGRMPFAYAHLVQVLVDAVLWMYPIGAFASGMSLQLGLAGTAFLTICYQGLFDLSKQFLDPYHNEGFWNGGDAIMVDTLIAETNAGSLRWVRGLEEMPIPFSAFKDSVKLEDFILPDEGYSVEETTERMEQQMLDALQDGLHIVEPDLSPEEYERKSRAIQRAVASEYEETQRIMNAPAAADFVPGIDDSGTGKSDDDEADDDGDITYEGSMANGTDDSMRLGTDPDKMQMHVERSGMDRFRQYLNATTFEHDHVGASDHLEMIQKHETTNGDFHPNGESTN